ncbi:MAG: hypothetical protein WBE26_00740 [Phycisphaerae bacterium]
MMHQNRMSPLTALFIGIFGVGAVGIASGAAIVLYSMRIIDTRATELLGFAENTVGGTLEALPELLESLPPTLKDLLNDQRAPEYAANIDVDVNFIADERSGGLRPVLTITNNGSEVVSMLAVRVAALQDQNVPVQEWTEVVATPIAIENEWRGPLMPGSRRYVVVSCCRNLRVGKIGGSITGAVEISEIRIWRPPDES